MDRSDERISGSEKVVLVLLGLAFVPAVVSMAGVWSSLDYYSHGFLVPVVAYWAAARNRRRAHLGAPRDVRGLWIGGAALAVYLVGLGTGSATTQGLGFVGAVAAVVAYLTGVSGLRTLAFPVAFLGFMVPIPPDWLAPVIVGLQLLVSVVAVELVAALGFVVTRAGNVIELPGATLFVAEACSGITSIVTLTPLAVVLAYFTEPSAWRRVALVAAVVPIAMLGNLLRVVATIVAADRFGAAEATSGPLHESAGLLTFVFACLLLIGLGDLLRRFAGSSEPDRSKG